MADDQQFYVGQKVIIEKDGKVLVLHDPVFGTDLPGGKIQEGETDFQRALIREVFEETGLSIAIGKPFHTGFVVVPSKIDKIQHKNLGKKIFMVFFKATYVSGEIRLSEEHDRYDWVDKKTYRNITDIEDSLGEMTKALEAYFTD